MFRLKLAIIELIPDMFFGFRHTEYCAYKNRTHLITSCCKECLIIQYLLFKVLITLCDSPPLIQQILYIYIYIYIYIYSQSVGITTAYGLDGPGIESRCGRDFPHLSRPSLRPTQPPVQWVPGLSR